MKKEILTLTVAGLLGMTFTGCMIEPEPYDYKLDSKTMNLSFDKQKDILKNSLENAFNKTHPDFKYGRSIGFTGPYTLSGNCVSYNPPYGQYGRDYFKNCYELKFGKIVRTNYSETVYSSGGRKPLVSKTLGPYYEYYVEYLGILEKELDNEIKFQLKQ